MKPTLILSDFDKFLVKQNTSFSAIVIGGSALAVMGVISRETQDCDVLDPKIPDNIKKLSEEFADKKRKAGEVLRDDWLNNGPASLTRDLPSGWRNRTQSIYTGEALTLHTLGRGDFLKSKLFAYCDRGTDLDDCIAMNPTKTELQSALPWLNLQDANPGWPNHVDTEIKELARRLGYAI